jgi:hypothetical protein
MRVESINLPQAAQKHSKVHGSGKSLPGAAAEKANEAVISKQPVAENLAASGVADSEKAAKSAPKGLSNAMSQLAAKENGGKGIEQALEMLTRNLSRYSVTPPTTETGNAAPPTDDATPAAGTETPPVGDTGTVSDGTDSTTAGETA